MVQADRGSNAPARSSLQGVYHLPDQSDPIPYQLNAGTVNNQYQNRNILTTVWGNRGEYFSEGQQNTTYVDGRHRREESQRVGHQRRPVGPEFGGRIGQTARAGGVSSRSYRVPKYPSKHCGLRALHRRSNGNSPVLGGARATVPHDNSPMPADTDRTVLIVDDERSLRKMYEASLDDVYEVVTAADGNAALEAMNDNIDVVLIDRRMPGLSGGEVLRTLRERGNDVAAAMVTAVEPAEDIIDLPFDDYLVKPVDRNQLLSTVELLANRAQFDEKSREYYRLAAKKATLKSEDGFDHTASKDYQQLTAKMSQLREELDETLDDILAEDPADAFRSI
jgi:DNA-binding response OmpR family regulator